MAEPVGRSKGTAPMVEPLTTQHKTKGQNKMKYRDYVAMRQDFLMNGGRDLLTKQAWKRVNHCQAWFCKRNGYWWLKSYSTIVAVYDEDLDMLISFGRYSSTTYQHVRKFRNNYLPHGWDTEEMNLMVDDCWGCYSGFRW